MFEFKDQYRQAHEQIPLEAELGQLQEEAAELVVACSKYRRKFIYHASTTKTEDEILDNLFEEMSDTLNTIKNVLYALDRDGICPMEESTKRVDRWADKKEMRLVQRMKEILNK